MFYLFKEIYRPILFKKTLIYNYFFIELRVNKVINSIWKLMNYH